MKQCGALALAVLLFGCKVKGEKPTATPEQAYQTFAHAVRTGDIDTAWSSLSKSTQTTLSEKSKAIAAQSQGLIQDSPARIFFQSGLKPTENVGEVKIVKQTDSLAIIEVSGHQSKTQQLTLLKEEHRWTIDLTEAVK